MATTYDGAALGSSPLFRARFALGDVGKVADPATGSAVWLLTDEEIVAMTALWGYPEGVAQLAEGLAVRFAQEPDEYEDEAGVRVRWNERIRQWNALAARLRAGEARTKSAAGGAPRFGISTGPDMRGFPR